MIMLYDYAPSLKGWAAMKNADFVEQAKLRTQEFVSSPEYRKGMERFAREKLAMEQLAQQLEAKLPAIRSLAEAETLRTEYASGSDLHRGFYCPSPVFDFIVGNTHRGKLLKRLTSRSKPSHAYGFSCDGRLLWCKWLKNGAVTNTEYLLRDGEEILGIMHDSQGYLNTLTKEVYREGKLQSYACGSFSPIDHENQRLHLLFIEDYAYDSDGLQSCQQHDYTLMLNGNPNAPINFQSESFYRCEEYVFERANGLLSGYRNQGRLYTGCKKPCANPAPQSSGIILSDIKE